MASLLRNLLLALIPAAITLLVAEAVLHAVGYPPRQTDFRQFSEVDSVRGWRNAPGRSGEYVSDEYRHLLRYNSWGARGAEFPPTRAERAVRVLLMGDSFTDAYSVAEDERVSAVLERVLRPAGGCPVEVLALGNAGYSTDQALLWYRDAGVRLNPDVVVLLFYYNDVWYNARPTYQGIPKPHFALAGDSVVIAAVPWQSERARGGAAASRRNTGVAPWLEAHSRLYRLAERAAKQSAPLRAAAQRLGFGGPPPESLLTTTASTLPGEFTVFLADPPAATEEAWSVTAGLLRQFRRETARAGSGLVVFHVPFRGQVQAEQRGAPLAQAQHGLDLRAVSRRLASICADEAIRCVEPADTFAAEARHLAPSGERLYYHLDTHWNATGHAFAARVLAGALQDEVDARCRARTDAVAHR